MQEYILAHQLEKKEYYCYNERKKSSKEKYEIANYIHNSYNTMTDVDIRNTVLNCMDKNEMKRILLLFELKHYNPNLSPKKMSLNEFKLIALDLFDRYQCKAGGFKVEDNKWLVHDSTSIRHQVRENELLFENTINICDDDDEETSKYFKYILKRLNDIASNINVELRQLTQHRQKVITLMIWAKDKDLKNKSLIGL